MTTNISNIKKLQHAYTDAVDLYNDAYYSVYYYEVNGIGYADPTTEELEYLAKMDPRAILQRNPVWSSASRDEQDMALAAFVRNICRKHELAKARRKYYNVVAVGYNVYLDEDGSRVKNGQRLLKKAFPNSWIK